MPARQTTATGQLDPRVADPGAETKYPSQAAARSMGCRARLARGPQRSQSWRTALNLFSRPLCLRAFVVWSVVARYNYLLIVITKCRRYQNPAPWKSSLIRPTSPPDPRARPASRARVRTRAGGRSLADRRDGPQMALPGNGNGSTDVARRLVLGCLSATKIEVLGV